MGFGVCILVVSWYLYFPRDCDHSPQGAEGAELAAAAVTGKIIHPPGYPFYSLISQLFVHFVPGSAIASLAVLSAIFQSFAAFTLYFICFD